MTPTHYLIHASDVAKLREALTTNRVMAKDDQGNYTKEITPKVITEALSILNNAQGVGVVALRWPNKRGHHNYCDEGETWSPSAGEPEQLYARRFK
jgi:hypothetical protein